MHIAKRCFDVSGAGDTSFSKTFGSYSGELAWYWKDRCDNLGQIKARRTQFVWKYSQDIMWFDQYMRGEMEVIYTWGVIVYLILLDECGYILLIYVGHDDMWDTNFIWPHSQCIKSDRRSYHHSRTQSWEGMKEEKVSGESLLSKVWKEVECDYSITCDRAMRVLYDSMREVLHTTNLVFILYL